MKLKREHYDHIKAAVSRLFHEVDLRRDAIVRQGRAKDVEKRLRWDLLFATPGMSRWICDNIYPYANDDHIDTALRRIMSHAPGNP